MRQCRTLGRMQALHCKLTLCGYNSEALPTEVHQFESETTSESCLETPPVETYGTSGGRVSPTALIQLPSYVEL
jgi:hypothetical protein